jgi:hypothetical protein
MSALWEWFGFGAPASKALAAEQRKLDKLARSLAREHRRSQESEAALMARARQAQEKQLARLHVRQYVRAAVVEQRTQLQLARYLERVHAMRQSTTLLGAQVEMQAIAGALERIMRRVLASESAPAFARRMHEATRHREQLALGMEATEDAFANADDDDDVIDADGDVDAATDTLMQQLDAETGLALAAELGGTGNVAAASAAIRHRAAAPASVQLGRDEPSE